MANTDELLAKAQKRLEKQNSQASQPRRIQRSGPTRPWQENLNKTAPEITAVSSDPQLEKRKSSVETTFSNPIKENSFDVGQEQSSSLTTKNFVDDKLDPNLKSHNSSPQGETVPPGMGMPISKIEAPSEQLKNESKSVTNQKQLRNDSVTENATQLETVTEHLRNNSATITEQFRNKSSSLRNNSGTKQEQLRNNSVTENVAKSVAVTEYLRNNSVTHLSNPPHANRLSGNKLKIVMTIHAFCQERGSLNSGPISREVFENRTGIDGEVIRVTSTRLVKEGFISILESKRGNGGYTVYELNAITHSQLTSGQFRNDSVTSLDRMRNNSVTERVTERVTDTSYSNSSYNNSLNTNITIPENSFADRIELPPDLIPTGIKLANILPHVKNEADLERINESLAAYAFDYSQKRIIKTGIFYGAIKNGQYFHSDDYVREMEKERQKQALAGKAREEANRQTLPSFNVSAKTKAAEEFEREYSLELVEKVFKTLEKGDLDILQPMLEKGLDYLPFRETLKNKFIAIRMEELEHG